MNRSMYIYSMYLLYIHMYIIQAASAWVYKLQLTLNFWPEAIYQNCFCLCALSQLHLQFTAWKFSYGQQKSITKMKDNKNAKKTKTKS